MARVQLDLCTPQKTNIPIRTADWLLRSAPHQNMSAAVPPDSSGPRAGRSSFYRMHLGSERGAASCVPSLYAPFDTSAFTLAARWSSTC